MNIPSRHKAVAIIHTARADLRGLMPCRRGFETIAQAFATLKTYLSALIAEPIDG